MIRFKEIEISNFWSFGKKPTIVNLDKNQTALIIGDNRDTGDAGNSRNGVGKSTIYQAIIYALFGKGTQDVKQDEFINITNGKKMSVRLKFDVNGDECEVLRQRKPNNLEFTVNGESYTRDSLANTDSEIKNKIGMNHSIFLNTMFMSPDVTPFLAMKPAEQRNFIEEILSLDTLSMRAETLKALKKDNDAEIKIEEASINKDIQHNESVNSQIEEQNRKSEEWLRKQQSTIDTYKEEIEKLNKIDVGHQQRIIEAIEGIKSDIDKNKSQWANIEQQIKSLVDKEKTYTNLQTNLYNLKERLERWDKDTQSKLETAQKKIDEFESIDIDKAIEVNESLEKVDQEIAEHKKQLDEVKSNLESAKKEYSKFEKEEKDLDKGVCPYCEQSYHSEDQVNYVKGELKRYDGIINEYSREFSDIEQKLEELNSNRKQIIEDIGNLTPDYIEKLFNEAEKNRETKNSLENQDNPYIANINEMLEQYESKTIDDLNKYFTEIIQSSTNEKENLERQIDDIDKTIQDLKEQLEENVSQQKFDKVELDNIQETINSYKSELKVLESEKNPHVQNIETLNGQMKTIDESKLKDLQNKSEHYKVLTRLLTDNKSFIRKNIVDQYIPFINSRINYYLDYLDAPHFVEIQNDMSVEILYMNRNVSYGSASKGESLRLNLASCLAFRDIVSMMGKSSNILLLDEFLDSGGDDAFFHKAISILTNYCENVFMISHRDLIKDYVDTTMTVVKQNGFSRLEYS